MLGPPSPTVPTDTALGVFSQAETGSRPGVGVALGPAELSQLPHAPVWAELPPHGFCSIFSSSRENPFGVVVSSFVS